MNIGWVGLGTIGTLMVKRLLEAGEQVTVYSRGAGLAQAKALGAQDSADYAAVAGKCDLLILCLYDDAQVRSVLFDHGALNALKSAVELLGLAERYGLETQTVAQVLQTCSGGSFAMRLFQAAPVSTVLNASRPYLEKDVATALSAAKDAGIDIGGFAATAGYFRPGV